MRPEDLHYTKEHDWLRLEGETATMGITDFAAGELGDIVYIELPEVGSELSVGDSLGTIETVKAVEELHAPVGGKVVAVNEALEETPELTNQDPFGDGWLLKIEVEDFDAGSMLDAAAYEGLVEGQG